MTTLKDIRIKNHNLNNPEVKMCILKYLRSKINSNTKFYPITKQSDLTVIRDDSYIVCPRLNGTRIWIIFFHVGANYYAVYFPKKNQFIGSNSNPNLYSDINPEHIGIFAINIDAHPDIYKGTVMEGIDYKYNDECYLIVDEIYYLEGQNQLLKPKDDRLNKLLVIQNQDKFTMKNKFRLCVSNFYYKNKSDITILYDKIRSNPDIQEIIFYPMIYGRPIYTYTILDSDLKDDVINVSNFKMHRPENADVYKLFDLNTGKKIGIAYIPDIETSKKCKEWFKKKSIKKLIVKCKLDCEKDKWIPLEPCADQD